MKFQQLAVLDIRVDKRIKLILHPCPVPIADEIFWDLNQETEGQSQITLLFTVNFSKYAFKGKQEYSPI